MNLLRVPIAERTTVLIISIILFLALFFIVPSTVTADSGPTDWMIVTVDGKGSVGSYSSIAIDSDNKVYISYRDDTNGHLEMASNFPGVWVDIGPVDNSVNVGDTSIALDSNGMYHISYYDTTNTALRYVTLIEGTWNYHTIDDDGAVGHSTSMVIDSQDNVHICYYDATNDDLKYATNSGGSWSNQTLYSSGDVGSDLSLAIDSNDNLHISYYDATNDDLKYATNAGGSWADAIVDNSGDVGLGNSIAIDSNDKVYISYQDYTNRNLKYATNAGGSWTNSTIDSSSNVGYYSSIAVDSNDKVHISHFDGGDYSLRYSTNSLGSWDNEVVFNSADAGGPGSIGMDSNDRIYISFWDFSNGDLKYATKKPGNIYIQTIDETGNVGLSSSIATDSSDNTHISYYDNTHADLRYATNSAGYWTRETIDSEGNVGSFTSIAIDPDDKVHIAYYDNTNGDLKYATNSAGSWTNETVDTAFADVGINPSISLDSNDNVHISYYDNTHQNLKYATGSSGSWTIQLIDHVGIVGQYNSLTIDSNDVVHVCYEDYTNKDLKYANNSGGSWSNQTLDSAGVVGSHCSIDIDPWDHIHISYYDQTLSSLKYAFKGGGAWSFQTVDDGEVVGLHSSIAADATGRIHISYHDSYPNYNLRYATNGQGVWSSMTLDSEGMVGYDTCITIDSDDRVHISYFDSTNADMKYLQMYIKPSAPLNLDASVGDSYVQLEWSPPLIDVGYPVEGYAIFYGLEENDMVYLNWSTSTSCLHTSASNGVTYFYKVKAYNVFGEGAPSNMVMATPGTMPTEPLSLHAEVGNTQVVLLWDPPADDGGASVEGYNVYRGMEESSLEHVATVEDPNFLDTSVENGQLYYYQVKAFNSFGEGQGSEIITAAPGTTPSQPLNLTHTSGDSFVLLFWSAPLEDGGFPIEGYNVYKGVEEGSLELLDSMIVAEYWDDSVTNGLQYLYRVTAFNAFGEGPPSEMIAATPGATPSSPRSLTYETGDSYVHLSWVPPENDGGFPVEEYCIYRGPDEVSMEYLATVVVTDFNDTSVINGHTYCYQVSAWNIRGEGEPSGMISATPATSPSAPESLQAEAGDSYVILTWIEPTNGGSGIEGYNVYRGEDEGLITFLTVVEALELNDTSVVNGITFYYQVSAFNPMGEGPLSNMVEALPQAGVVKNVPSAPLNLEAHVGNSEILLTWDPPQDNGGSTITNYMVYRGTAPGEESDLEILGNVLEYLDTSVENGVTYYYLVNAINAIGEGPFSNEALATPMEITPPSAPTITDHESGDSYIYIVWSPPESDGGSPIEGYNIYRGESESSLEFLTVVEALHFNDTSVVNGITFHFQVTAFNSFGEGEASNIISATPATIPSVPQGLQAEAGDSYVLLTWVPSSDDGGSEIECYMVYRGESESSLEFLISVGGLQYNDTLVTNGITYHYRIAAINAIGEGPMSDIVNATPQVGIVHIVPSAPLNLEVDGGTYEIVLTWDAPEDNGGAIITHYNIYRGTSSGSEVLIETINNTLLFTDTTASQGITYYYQVSAINAVGEGPLSNEASISLVEGRPPSAPEDLSATHGNGIITLTWSPPSDDGGATIINYRVYRGTSSGSEILLVTIGNVLTYTDTGLTNGITYYYKVSAMNEFGNGPLSIEVSATPSAPTVPSAPQDLEAEAGDSYILLTWAPPSDDGGSSVTGYNLYRGASADSIQLLINLGSVLEYNDTAVTNGITYYYQVIAVNSIGEGTSSDIINATPEGFIIPTVPTAPQDPQGFSGDGYVLLTWSAPSDDGGSDITAYNIYRGTESDNLTQLTSVPSTQTSYNDTSVENGQTYYYRITAVNDVGEGTQSTMVSDAPGTEDGRESDPTMIFLIIGVIVVVAIIAVLMFILRKR
jgi:fibronectin type 3 domain-containing protein